MYFFKYKGFDMVEKAYKFYIYLNAAYQETKYFIHSQDAEKYIQDKNNGK